MTQQKTTTCPACGSQAAGRFCNACGAALTPGTCRQCNAPLAPGARFCNECGAPAGATTEPVGGSQSAGTGSWLPWTIAGALLVGVTTYFLAQNARTESTPVVTDGSAPMAPFAADGGGGGGGAPPDISSMSPEERAARLYDRVMRYSEQGKKDSLQLFGPMALSSFESIGRLDAHLRYDYGRVAMETGNLDLAIAQADTILAENPTHLLGLALAARGADARGNTSQAKRLWARFEAARSSELAKGLAEYEGHRADIDRAAELAKGKP